MEWVKVRKKHKQLLSKWGEIKKEMESLDKLFLQKEIKPREEIKPIPVEVLNKWCTLRQQERVIFDEINTLYRKYYRQRN